MWTAQTEPGSSERATSSLNHCLASSQELLFNALENDQSLFKVFYKQGGECSSVGEYLAVLYKVLGSTASATKTKTNPENREHSPDDNSKATHGACREGAFSQH